MSAAGVYLRFQTARLDRDSHRNEGVFAAAYALLDCDGLPAWAWREVRRSLDWFNAHLRRPRRFTKGRNGRRQGLCWFDPAAGACVREARHLAWLCGEHGPPVFEVRTRTPGVIVYQDRQQVVAVPGRRRDAALYARTRA